ncbi:hypothetical protein DFH09DRAFT_1342008 [Mycena vulgaris]|nr:hypothetical protein DFH09DRAFT_1342008 [Mycena vulgaris]
MESEAMDAGSQGIGSAPKKRDHPKTARNHSNRRLKPSFATMYPTHCAVCDNLVSGWVAHVSSGPHKKQQR